MCLRCHLLSSLLDRMSHRTEIHQRSIPAAEGIDSFHFLARQLPVEPGLLPVERSG